MKALFFIAALLFCACSSSQNTTLIFAEREYEKIIVRDSIICEQYIAGDLGKEDVRVLLEAQHISTEVLRLTLDGLEKLK
jgi:hypothetical protein